VVAVSLKKKRPRGKPPRRKLATAKRKAAKVKRKQARKQS